MINIFRPYRKKTQLTELRSFRKIQSFEERYSLHLSKISKNFEQTFETLMDLNKIHKSLAAFINLLKLTPSIPAAQDINPLLDGHIKTIASIHAQNTFWLTAYLGLIWPEEIQSKKIRRQTKKHTKNEWQTRAKNSLETLSNLDNFNPDRKNRLDVIIHHYAQHRTLDRHSSSWHNNHRQLVSAIYDELIHTANEGRQHIKDSFKKSLYCSKLSGGQTKYRQGIIDWMNGYKKPGPVEISTELTINQTITKSLRLCEHRKNIKLALKGALIGSVVLLILWCAHFYHVDSNIYTFLKDRTLKILGLDPASVNLKQKKEFFHKYIIELNNKIKPEEIFEHIRIFNDQHLYEKESGAYYLAENILQKYFLLLTKQDIPQDLKAQVIHAAGLIDLNIQKTVLEISNMFESKTIEDSKLRKLLLELRRAFVRHNIFPFAFIVIQEDTPYLFLYPETIIKRFKFPSQELDRIGFKSSYYSQYVRFPLKVFVVQGDRYPFKDRAGYFEGEFAIVFADLAARTEWSAWHEFAHIIDHMRFVHGGRAFPKNIEINAVLLPAIFSEDAKAYLLDRVFPIVETAEADDVYVQASKGILNGFILKELLPINLITDKFIDADIQAVKKLILSKDNDSIKTIALDIFKNPDRYLKTAKTGQVKGIISNAEEVIAGTPRAPFQGFILSGYGKSYKNDTSGIKFLFDNENLDQGFFQGKNILVIIQEIFFFMLQAHDSTAKGFTLMNIVAATVDFFLILGLFMLVHWLASPIRKRKFYGPALIDVVNAVYKNHPLSDGRGSEEEPGEKKLVVQALSSRGNISDELRSNIRALKSGISQERCSVFDTLLTLAPFNPQNSAIRSKWHDFLFWLPWTGPIIARSPWFFGRQKSFRQWEMFNEQLIALAKGINQSTHQNSFRQAYMNILKDFKKPAKTFDSSGDKTLAHLNETEKSINAQFNEWSRSEDLKKPVRARQLPWLTENEGEFSHLSSYSWNDDVKRIDWKATARSSNGEAKVRKYTGSASAQIDFLFDFRSIAKQHGQQRIARDLVQALQILKHDHELKAITLIMPSGDLRNRTLNLKNTINRTELSRQIWSAVTQEFEADRAERQALAAHDLIFYTEEENRMYRHITRLTDFDHNDQNVKPLSAISTRSFNIYLIGVDDYAREEIMNLLPRTHQPFYWR